MNKEPVCGLCNKPLVKGDVYCYRGGVDVPPVHERCAQSERFDADEPANAADEIERSRKEVEALRATNAQLAAENDALYGSFMDGRTPPIDAAMKGPAGHREDEGEDPVESWVGH